MSADERTRALADRLARVEWLDDDERAPSRARLMSEYLRRAALWAQRLDAARSWPFFDVAQLAAPGTRADPELVREVYAQVAARGANHLDRRLCEYALHFAAAQPGSELPDPFAPLVELFERGGQFQQEAGLIYFGPMGVKLGSFADHLNAEPFDTAPAALDALDAAWQARREEMRRRVRAGRPQQGG
ncbi:hypothetical protein Cme02nite_12700 [Catellatospora methionotrophica]|uniref:Uncharacterized protein n=1 Tax=Catellatospora methionotrophica TaxID=121620 RepID=A0A8J3L217_9ACTN|nr:hypothetical protein [Catellatospora methionotrophica]GIG12938.1 hypothetical protein Cme02nite_12700 [Catellatospora methionotrophica]